MRSTAKAPSARSRSSKFKDLRRRIGIAAALMAVLAFALPSGASALELGKIEEFTGAAPTNLVAGPEGNVWFTDAAAGKVGRVTPGGAITEYSCAGCQAGVSPNGIAVGADGKIWFTIVATSTESEEGRIGRIDPANPEAGVTECSEGLQSGGKSHPLYIAAGPDGNLWFSDNGAASGGKEMIGRITMSCTIIEFGEGAGLNLVAEPTQLTAGADGNVWFADKGKPYSIGRVTPSGEIKEFQIGDGTSAQYAPGSIALGPDGNVWFTLGGSGESLGSITPSGEITLHATPGTSQLSAIVAGPDGNLWMQQQTGKNELQKLEIKAGSGLTGTYKLGFEGKETGAECTGDLTSGSKEIKNVSCGSGAVIRGQQALAGEGIPAKDFVEKCNNANTCGVNGASVTKVLLTVAATVTKTAVPFTTNLSVVESGTLNSTTTIRQALETLSTIGAGNVSVAGSGFTSPITRTIEFISKKARTNVPQIECNASGLGGVSPSCTLGTEANGEVHHLLRYGPPAETFTSFALNPAETSLVSTGYWAAGGDGNLWMASGGFNKALVKFGLEYDTKLKVTCTGSGSGTVSSEPSGAGCGSTAEYLAGTEVKLTATPESGSEFTGWSGACTGTGPCEVTMNEDKEVTANFEPEPGPTNLRTLTITKSANGPGGTGSVSSKPKGIKCGTTCSSAVARMFKSTPVVLTAKPTLTSAFVKWENAEEGGVCDGSTNPVCTVPMSEDESLEAIYSGTAKTITPTETLTLSKGESEDAFGKGTVKASGLVCEADCDETKVLYQGPVTEPKVKPGKTVILKQAPAFGSKFLGWTGCDSVNEAGECTVEMDEAHTIEAEYEALPAKVLTLNKAYGSGNGSVSSKPKGIKCATTCTQAVASMPEGAAVELLAKPGLETTFVEWVGGDCNGSTNPVCIVTMNTDEVTKAVFSKAGKAFLGGSEPTLTLSKEGSGLGTVKASGLTCEVLCTSSSVLYQGPLTEPKVKPGKTVILKATSAPGSTKVAWSGCDSVTEAGECVVEMDEAHAVSATFDELE